MVDDATDVDKVPDSWMGPSDGDRADSGPREGERELANTERMGAGA